MTDTYQWRILRIRTDWFAYWPGHTKGRCAVGWRVASERFHGYEWRRLPGNIVRDLGTDHQCSGATWLYAKSVRAGTQDESQHDHRLHRARHHQSLLSGADARHPVSG